MKLCPRCKEQNEDNATRCYFCGYPLVKSSSPPIGGQNFAFFNSLESSENNFSEKEDVYETSHSDEISSEETFSTKEEPVEEKPAEVFTAENLVCKSCGSKNFHIINTEYLSSGKTIYLLECTSCHKQRLYKK